MNVLVDSFVIFIFFVWQKLSQKKFIILCDKYGNIGNQLYMSCFLIKWAEEFNLLTFNFGLIHNQKYFKKPDNDIFLRYPYKKSFNSRIIQLFLATSLNRTALRLLSLKIFVKIKSLDLLQIKTIDDFNELESKIKRNDITLVRGFIHNQPYSIFKNVFQQIKEYFEVYPRYKSDILKPLKSLSDCDIFVGIAIRHGDYKTWNAGKYYLNTEKYQKWMEKIESLFSPQKVGFFIASDESQDLTIFEKQTFFFREGHPIANLYSLSKCDYLISVPSSFSGWAHFIGKVPQFVIDEKVRNLHINDFQNW